MIALLSLVIAAAAGTFVVMAIDRGAGRGVLIGSAILVGLSIPAAAMFALSLLGVRWSLGLVLVCTIAVAAGCGAALLRRQTSPAPEPRIGRSLLSAAIDAGTVILLSGYALFALAGPSLETDYVSIWGLKGLRFWHAGGIDFAFLERGWNAFSHPDYPILLPLIYDWAALVGGKWDDRWIGVFFVAFGAAAIAIVRTLLAEDLGSDVAAAAGTFVLVPFAVSPYLGLGEGPMIAYAAAGVLIARKGFRENSSGTLTLAALLLGLAASLKNEGLTLVVATLVAAAFAFGPKGAARLWPAVALPLPWLIVRQIHGLSTDLAAEGVLSRVLRHVRDVDQIVLAISRAPFGKPFFWLGIALALAIGGLSLLRREKFLLGTVAIQYLFYVSAYFVTPHDIEWHVKWSWERVLNQMTLLLAFAAVSAVASHLTTRGEPQAEPEQTRGQAGI